MLALQSNQWYVESGLRSSERYKRVALLIKIYGSRISQRQIQYHEVRLQHQSSCSPSPVISIEQGVTGLQIEQSSELITTTTLTPTMTNHLEDINTEIK